jgi:hypothetical protein
METQRRNHGWLTIGTTAFLARTIRADKSTTPSPFTQQSYLIGEVGPFEYPTAEFLEKTKPPTAQNAFIVPGYDIGSSSRPSRTGGTIDGWRLVVSVTSDIPIPDSDAVKELELRDPVFDAALVSLSAPDRLAEKLEEDQGERSAIADNWSLCSAIWPLGLSELALEGKQSKSQPGLENVQDLSCNDLLSSECIAEMEAGFNTAGFCQNQTLPRSCAPFLVGGGGENSDAITMRAFNVPQSRFSVILFCSRLHFRSYG